MDPGICEYAGGVSGNQRHNAIQILVGHDRIDKDQGRALPILHHRLQMGEVLPQRRGIVADVRYYVRQEGKSFPTTVEVHYGSRVDYRGDHRSGIRQA